MNKIALLAALLIPALSIADIYKSKDEHGNIVYTDIAPEKDAAAVELPELNVVETSKVKTATTREKIQKKMLQNDAKQSNYGDISIIQPANDETIRSNEGKVLISVHISPRLFAEKGDRLVVKMNGAIVNNGSSNTIALENIDRGTHNLTAYIENHQGRELASAKSISFHLKRAAAGS